MVTIFTGNLSAKHSAYQVIGELICTAPALAFPDVPGFTVTLIEIRLKHKYPLPKIIETLRNVSCTHLDQNHFVFDYHDEITEDLNQAFDLNFGDKFMTLKEIKNYLARAKRA